MSYLAQPYYVKFTQSFTAKLVFLLGESSTILEESEDILQINIQESYDHLSYKTLAAFLWVSKNCAETKYVIKIDDDVSLFWNETVEYLRIKYPKGIQGDTIECPSVMRNMPPWRPRKFGSPNTVMNKW